jgi:P2-related tail formation protein
VSRQRDKGTKAETALVEHLRGCGWPDTDRRALQGTYDKGDIRWLPWLAVEVKHVRTPAYGQWLREAETERGNLAADYGVVVHKPHGTSVDQAGRWHVVMTMDTFVEMVKEIEHGRSAAAGDR